MRQHRKRWAIEAGALVLLFAVALPIEASRTCTTAEFDLPTSCPAYLAAATVYLAIFVFIVEAAMMIRRRTASRPCPRCGERVRRGKLDCAACNFDFRTI